MSGFGAGVIFGMAIYLVDLEYTTMSFFRDKDGPSFLLLLIVIITELSFLCRLERPSFQ